jgi:hypothetical protein
MSRAFEGGWLLIKMSDDQRILNVLETFAGAGGNEEVHAGWGQAARDRGHNVLRNEIMYSGHPDKEWNVDLGYMPEFPGDIRMFNAEDIISGFKGKTPDVFFASPPCEGFSIAAQAKGWEGWGKEFKDKKKEFNRARNRGDKSYFDQALELIGPIPKTFKTEDGRSMMNHTLKLIDDLQDYRLNNEGRDADDPMYWWMENPVGMMRFQPEVGGRPMAQPVGERRTGARTPAASITHSSYSGPMAERLGFESHPMPGHPSIPAQKPTDLWTNAIDIWTPRQQTKKGMHPDAPQLNMTTEEIKRIYGNRIEVPVFDPAKAGDTGVYHEFAPRGARSGTQDVGAFTTASGTRIPAYHAKSLIPYGLGLDTIIAVERARQGLGGSYPPLPQGAQRRLF